jgi:hypothetical protein
MRMHLLYYYTEEYLCEEVHLTQNNYPAKSRSEKGLHSGRAGRLHAKIPMRWRKKVSPTAAELWGKY